MIGSLSANDELRHNYGAVLRRIDKTLYAQVQDHEAGINVKLAIPPNPISIHFGCDSDPRVNPNISHIICTLEHEGEVFYNKLLSRIKGKSHRIKRDRGIQFLGNLLSIAIGTATEPMIGGLTGDVTQILQLMGRMTASDTQRNNVLYNVALTLNQLIEWTRQHTAEMNGILGNITHSFRQHINVTTDIYTSALLGEGGNLLNQINENNKITYIQRLLQYHTELDKWSDTLDILEEGKIPGNLVQNSELETLVSRMKSKLREIGSNVRPIGNVKSWRNSLKDLRFNGSHASFRIRVPFSHVRETFAVYKPIVFPIPIHTHEYDTKGYTELVLDPRQILIIDKPQRGYMLTKDDWLNECRSEGDNLFCFQDFAYRKIDAPSCLIALFLDNKKMISETCKFQIVPLLEIKPNYIMLDTDEQILINQGPIGYLECKGQVNSPIDLPVFTIINIPCSCHLTTKYFTLYVSRKNCQAHNNTLVSLNTGFNLPLAMIFSLQTEAYTGKSIEPSIFTLSIPEVEDVNFRLKDIPELMVESGIIIEEMTAKLESHEQGVRDIWGKMHEKFRSTSTNYIFSFVTFTIACISFLLTIFTLCRLQAVYIGLALIPSIKANMLSKIVLRPIPWSDMPQEPEPTLPATYSQSYNSRNYLAWLVGVALALLLLRAVKAQSAQIARCVRCKGKPDQGNPWLRLNISVG